MRSIVKTRGDNTTMPSILLQVSPEQDDKLNILKGTMSVSSKQDVIRRLIDEKEVKLPKTK